jgi:hypothetical protein
MEKNFWPLCGACVILDYLYGRRFRVVTDHKSLTWIMNVKDPGSRLLRWRIKLEDYDYEVVYRKGALNTKVDY